MDQFYIYTVADSRDLETACSCIDTVSALGSPVTFLLVINTPIKQHQATAKVSGKQLLKFNESILTNYISYDSLVFQ